MQLEESEDVSPASEIVQNSQNKSWESSRIRACLSSFSIELIRGSQGKPSEIFCVKEPIFGAAGSRKAFRQLMKEDAIHQFPVTDNITFHNPPSAPHFGAFGGATGNLLISFEQVVGSLISPLRTLATL
ncbi:hypothetical protein TNIN_165581 [Trichonephila inaurata madagascariensis]|uniref:Uncharacterized protein n=1 Tax=Trichonephila inaurata madagascariensis TaxID=2747483 RepID=A0A8X6YMB2_9ARAC|nr:hypothetical protein TNIN_165581 [Trichonephila inaurata madagascariensis]